MRPSPGAQQAPPGLADRRCLVALAAAEAAHHTPSGPLGQVPAGER